MTVVVGIVWQLDLQLPMQCPLPLTMRGVLDTTLCDKVWQWLATGWWFPRVLPVSSTNKTDRHYIIKILLKMNLILLMTFLKCGMIIITCLHANWSHEAFNFWTLIQNQDSRSTWNVYYIYAITSISSTNIPDNFNNCIITERSAANIHVGVCIFS